MVAQQTLTLFVWVQILVPLPKSLGLREPRLFYEVWLSLVERYVRDVEAGGSNPLTSTIDEHQFGYIVYHDWCSFFISSGER